MLTLVIVVGMLGFAGYCLRVAINPDTAWRASARRWLTHPETAKPSRAGLLRMRILGIVGCVAFLVLLPFVLRYMP